MARTLTAYLVRGNVPGRDALQAAIKALGFKLALDDAYSPFETSGYLPCTYDGEDAGFDLRFGDVDSPSPKLAAALQGRDTAMKLRWSGDPREHFSAIAVCAALAAQFAAVIYDGDADALITEEELTARAKKISASI